MNNSTAKSSVITQVLFSAVAIAIGYLLLFGKSVQVLTLCQILCGGLVIAGIVSIASFFVTGDFKRIDRYGFTIGVLLVLLGCIGLLRINDLTQNFEMYTGLLALVLAVLTLQGTVQVKVLDYAVWIINLIISIACIAGSFCVLSAITPITGLVPGFSSWVLLICGCSCIFSLIVTWICILLAGRREKKAKQEAELQKEAALREAEAQKEAALKEDAANREAAAQREAKLREELANKEAALQEERARREAAQNQASGAVMDGNFRPAGEFEPAESHHTGFDSDNELPPSPGPSLEFGPSENFHTDFDSSDSQ